MKKILLTLGLFLTLTGHSQNWYDKPMTSSLATADLLLLRQSGTTKNFTIGTLAAMLNDTINILRAAFPPLWRSDIADTATVLRGEIAGAGTADTAWTYLDNYVFLKHINDSVGIGIETPSEKLEVNGNVKAIRGIFDNGYNNLLLGLSSGEDLTSGGTYNVFAGFEVAKDATTPDYCVGIGGRSLYSLTTGGANVGIGWQSGYLLSSGYQNTLGGVACGGVLTTGIDNAYYGYYVGGSGGASSSYGTRIGAWSGYDATGSGNVFAGWKSGYNNTASNGVNIGYESGYNLTENGSVTVGYEAGEAATSSVGLTAIGYNAGLNVTTGDFNTFLGYQTGDAVTTIGYHTAMGYEALGALQTSDGSSVFGYRAGEDATAAQGFTAIGTRSGASVTTGDFNTFTGYQSGDALTTTNYHTAMGYGALGALQTNDGSSVYGYQAGLAAVSAAALSAFGYQSGLALTIGDGNSFFGSGVGDLITTGDENTLLGYNVAGNSAVDISDNVMVGRFSGYSSTADGCIYLGYNSGYNNIRDNTLFIDNSSTATPLIWGALDADSLIIFGDFRVTGYAGGATAWTNESDRRLKKNISPIDNALGKVMKLKGVQFEWKDERELGKRIGFIAQDVSLVLPEVVSIGKTYSMQDAKITALLVEGMKAQQKQIRGMFVIIGLLAFTIGFILIRQRKYLRDNS